MNSSLLSRGSVFLLHVIARGRLGGMNSPRALVLLGIVTALSPFVGLPYSWLRVLLPILGIVIVVVAFRVRAIRPRRVEPVYDEQANA